MVHVLTPTQQEIIMFFSNLFIVLDGTERANDIGLFTVLIVAALMLGVVLAILQASGWLINVIYDFVRRKPCAHCGNRTSSMSDGEFPDCPAEQACCDRCTFEHRFDQMESLPCITCGQAMDKVAVENKVIAQDCPQGHGRWYPGIEHAVFEALMKAK